MGDEINFQLESGIREMRFRRVWLLVAQSCLTLRDPMNCSLARLLCPWDFTGKTTGVDCHFLLQGIFVFG